MQDQTLDILIIYVIRTIPYTDRNDLLMNSAEAICLEINKPKSKALKTNIL